LAGLQGPEGQEKAVALAIESLLESLYQSATAPYGGVVTVPQDVEALMAAWRISYS